MGIELRHLIEQRFRTAEGAFYSDEEHAPTLESNPHMHLLEACLAWAEIGNDPGWSAWARDLVQLALFRFIRRDSGALGESYTTSWLKTPGIAGRIIETIATVPMNGKVPDDILNAETAVA